MPRVSIIIPHRCDDNRLESTLVSVLENRPADSEVIVVHDGSYADPYDISDEVVFIETEPRAKTAGMLNEAVAAACSPLVGVVLDGVQVNDEWAHADFEAFDEDGQLAGLSVSIDTQGRTTFGLAEKAITQPLKLQAADVATSKASIALAGPQLACGFYRRKTLLALGGWNEQVRCELIDIELAMLMHRLDLLCELSDEPVAAVSSQTQAVSREGIKELAQLAVAYGQSLAGTKSAMGDLIQGCLSGNVSHAVAWATGIIGNRMESSISARVSAAEQELEALRVEQATQQWQEQGYRRAA